MANIKEIRASFEDEAAREAVKSLTILSVIKGQPFEETLADAIKAFLRLKEHEEKLSEGTWLSQTELIERLKADFEISTNPQTLLNYRNAGHFKGIFCADGEKKVFYILEKVAEVFKNPPTRQKPEKVAAV